MSINKSSTKSKTKSKGSKKDKDSIPVIEIAKAIVKNDMFIPGAVELDDGPDVEVGVGSDIKEILKEQDSIAIDGQELEQVFEDEPGALLEPGPGEALEPGDMSSRNEKVLRKLIPERTLQKMDKLIQCLRQYGNPTRAAQAAGITRSLAYNWRALYPGFAKVWAMAMNMAIDDLETEARRRAFQGILKPAGWYKGQAGGKVREYSDNLLMFLLKAYRPDKFKDRIEATGAAVLGIKVQITDYSHAEVAVTVPEDKQKGLPEGVIDVKDERKDEE